MTIVVFAVTRHPSMRVAMWEIETIVISEDTLSPGGTAGVR